MVKKYFVHEELIECVCPTCERKFFVNIVFDSLNARQIKIFSHYKKRATCCDVEMNKIMEIWRVKDAEG